MMSDNTLIIGAGIVAIGLTLAAGAHAKGQDDAPAAAIVMPNTAECAPPDDGPGSTAELAIETTIEDLAFSASNLWEFGEVSEFDCRWVRLSGHFNWIDYWHYRGRLRVAPHPMASGIATPWIENFADPATRRSELHNRRIDVSGFHYDLCRIAEAERARAAAEDDLILLNMGGPCHYGNDNGLMLANVRILSVADTPQARLRGEMNRYLIGNLADIAARWPEEIDAIWTVTVAALRDAAEGEETYLRSLGRTEESIAAAMADDDDWSSTVSMRAREIDNFDSRNFRAFVEEEFDLSESDEAFYGAVFGCVCLDGTCEHEWPLFVQDAYYLADDVLCVMLERSMARDWQIAG